ncbi:hypothetical protein GH714_027250 [Hevea brasiliensis]|uniref:Protein kinase domain-containing protein n=1 Tax=Hevea brasiliensis TaxID=3981 RepID=A0A6A6MDQ2_HEVBR|nr:hypothetical protein GH714_027250 [Hevea brasiliensis]
MAVKSANIRVKFASAGERGFQSSLWLSVPSRVLRRRNYNQRGWGDGLQHLVGRYTRSILQGIAYIHSHGYVHCDLKPENVLLMSSENAEFVPKIGDFGLAKKIEKSKKRKLFSCLGGTTSYMAPKTVVDHIQVPPSDIWALGCIVFEMFTGNEEPYFQIHCLNAIESSFLSVLDNTKGNEFGEILSEVHVNSTVTLSDIDKEFCASGYYEDWSSSSEEGSSSLLDEKSGVLQDPYLHNQQSKEVLP